MSLAPLISSFGITSIAELGDKTQLAIITLSTRQRPRLVFLEAMLAFTLIDGISVIIGGALANIISTFWIGVTAGLVFILFGVYSLRPKKSGKELENRKLAPGTSFSLVSIMELGDKTQAAAIVLAAEYSSPIQVFTGMILAYSVWTGVGIAMGAMLAKLLPIKYIRIGASIVFILFGIAFLLNSIL